MKAGSAEYDALVARKRLEIGEKIFIPGKRNTGPAMVPSNPRVITELSIIDKSHFFIVDTRAQKMEFTEVAPKLWEPKRRGRPPGVKNKLKVK